MYTSVSLDKCIYFYNCHNNYDVEHFIFPESSLILTHFYYFYLIATVLEDLTPVGIKKA